MPQPQFEDQLFRFLKQLKKNNEREWFNKNKSRYELEVRGPALDFIRELQKPLNKVSPYFQAIDKKVGGSLMRVYRDTRFGKDKTPYKTNVGIQFRHEMGRDVHAPGYYVHLEPNNSFIGVGIWHPASDALGLIRQAIDEDPTKWRRFLNNKKFHSTFELVGDRLKTAPRGVDKQHPLIADLRRKDFIGLQSISEKQITSDNFADQAIESFRRGRPLMSFLCDALRIPF